MPSDLDIEILTIDDSAPAVKTVLNKPKNPLKKKWRTVRKSTGVGGKAPHNAIPFKPLRKNLPVKPNSPRKTRKANPEYFDVEDDDSDDEIQVIENDPLYDVEVLSDGQSEGFCDMCGLYLENMKDMENHQETIHKLVTCKWCQNRMDTTDIRNHIGAKLCSKFTKLLGSHCSVHNEIETDDQLKLEDFKNCRPLLCDACSQRYDIKSLREFDAKSKSFVCPGCLHGRIDTSKDKQSEAAHLETILKESSETSDQSHSPEKIRMPIPEFLAVPNPIPLPDILLLTVDEDRASDNVGSSDVNDVTITDDVEPKVAESTEKNSPLKKRSNTGLTSKLVEMINTELQEKVLNEDKKRSPDEDIEEVEIEMIHTEVPKNAVENNVEVVNEDQIRSPEKDIEVVEIEMITELPKNVENNVEVESSEVVDVEMNDKEVEEVESPEVVDLEMMDTELTKNVVNSVEFESPLEVDVEVLITEMPINSDENEVDVKSLEEGSEVRISPDVEVLDVALNDKVESSTEVSVKSPSAVKSVDEIDILNDVSVAEISTNNPSSKIPAEEKETDPELSAQTSSPVNSALAPTPGRRVARKSTKPPQNPQRLPESATELLLFETLTIATPSPKRKLDSPVSSVRKVARKSTRPPAHPQRTLFNEEDSEVKKHDSSMTNIPEKGFTSQNNLEDLLKTPEKDDELEVLDEIVG
eukprot:GFUD01017197.1.p1 GENE.GFUD01017197.1~~GFUD01017197.1.p1  ORF type:complete len:696 (+),score=188.04 GFUD01017197.1:42-2129(+)